MTQLAKLDVAAAPACPNCRNRVADLDLDKCAAGAEHQCLFCGHMMRVPKPILDKLIAQREAAMAAQKQGGSFWDTIKAFFARVWGR